ncbi:hypothetical protein GBAR_LOCUS18483, partial [Geodia barretti]
GKGLGLVQKGESSSSTETDGSSPEYHYNISETESKGLRKVFKRFSGRLCYLMKEPVELATHLQIKNLIQYSVMIELLTSPESEQAKAITLVRDLHKQMKSHPAKLFSIVEVFLQNAALKEPGKEMLQEIGKVCPERAAFVLGSEQPPSDSQVEIPGSESKRQSLAENSTEWINSSAELRALRRSNVIFTRGLDPENLVRVLYTKGLLTPEERDNATKQTSTTCQ